MDTIVSMVLVETTVAAKMDHLCTYDEGALTYVAQT